MRVLHIISSGGLYGAEAIILNLAACLRDQGHQLVLGVFANSAAPNQELQERALAEGVELHEILCRGQLDWRVPAALRALVRSTGAALVHAHGYKADVYCWLAFRGSRSVPCVSTCHTWYDNDLALRIYGRLDRWVLRSFASVAAVSAQVRDRLLRAGVRPERIRLVRNGVDLRPFAGERTGRGSSRVGLVGRLAPEKGIDLFLRAAARVLEAEPDARFVIAGDGPERLELEAIIVDLGLTGYVEMPGRCEQMPAFYRGLDLLVSSSRQEGLPVAMLEAMASGLPVVATAVGEVPAIIREGETGVLVPPGDAAALTAGILDLLRNCTKRLALGQHARELVAAEYSVKRMAQEYLDIYESVLRTPSA